MKTKYKIIKKLFATALIGLCALCASTVKVQAQASSIATYTLTNMPATLSSNVVNFLTNSAGQAQVIPLTKNCALSVGGRAETSAGAGTEIVSGSFSVDGTTFGVAPFTLTSTLGTAFPTNAIGQPTVTVWTNWPESYLAGFAAVTFNQVTNTGPGIATNQPWTANRPTLNTLTY